MRYMLTIVLLIFCVGSNADVLTKAFADSAVKDIQKGIEELSRETDQGSAKIFAEALSKRIDREAYLVARQEAEVMKKLLSLQEEINKQKEIIENYAFLVSALEKRIKELENE